MSAEFRPCAVIPTYDNPATIGRVTRAVGEHLEVIVVDDGSAIEGREAVAKLGEEGIAQVHHRAENGGKGAAVHTGFELAREAGYSHVLQVDADGQHALEDIPQFLEVARAQPKSLILGAPRYDESAPMVRKMARQLTRFWTHVETLGPRIEDPMCGFRVYPVAAACRAARRCGRRMDFDIEVAVRMVWDGTSVVNLPTRVHYPEGGVSHFQMVRDNVRISWMHSRLAMRAIVWEGPVRLVGLRPSFGRRLVAPPEAARPA